MKPTKEQLVTKFAWTKDELPLVDPETKLFKFLRDIPHMADAALWHMNRLGLFDCEPKRILDLGCAVAMLATACRLSGHEVVAVNARERIIEIANKHLPIPNLYHHVNYGEPLPDWGTFNLIVLHGVDFCYKREPWGPDQYAWLWGELRAKLRPGGMLDIFKNRGPELSWFANAATWEPRGFKCRIVPDNIVQIWS